MVNLTAFDVFMLFGLDVYAKPAFWKMIGLAAQNRFPVTP
jgi:hypothetical protein